MCSYKIDGKNVVKTKQKSIPTAKNTLFDAFLVNPFHNPEFLLLVVGRVCWDGRSVGGRGKIERGGTAMVTKAKSHSE